MARWGCSFSSCSPVLARGHFDGTLQYKRSGTNLLTPVNECVNDDLIGIIRNIYPFHLLANPIIFFRFFSDSEQFTLDPVLILLQSFEDVRITRV
jgi:hypothetical protein